MKSKLVTSKKILCCSLWHSNVELGGQIVLAIMHTQLQLVLPIKTEQDTDIEMPIFDYEKIIFDCLESHSHIWIKKATGLGITEFMLRFMAWLCLRDNTLSGSEMCIVTGPRIDLAIGLIVINYKFK